jgi:superfamily II DNA or RNA helicase
MAWQLRRCQREPLADWAQRQPADYLAELTPAAGKTRLSAALARAAIDAGFVRRVNVVVPTTALKTQWAGEFTGLARLSLEPDYRTGARLARDRDGMIVTYAQLLERPEYFARMWEGSLMIHDEIHHAGLDSAWGQCLEVATNGAKHRFHLSGTPFRTNETPIAHLTYDERGFVVPDYRYGYRDALFDGIVRPLVAYPQGGEVTWINKDQGTVTARIDDPTIAGPLASERLRAMLYDEKWVETVLRRADQLLDQVRRQEPDAGAMAACISEAHARMVEKILRGMGLHPVIVLSSDPDSDRKIAHFRISKDRWLISIRKVFEGIDIPRLRVLGYLTTARTMLFVRQIVPRILRVRNGSNSPGYLLYPADPSLNELVQAMTDDVRGTNGRFRPQSNNFQTAEGVGGGGGEETADGPGVDVLEVTHEALSPFIAAAATVDPDALFLDAPAAAAATVAPSEKMHVDDHERLHRVLTAITKEAAHTFNISPKDIYGYWKKLRGPLESATVQELQRRVSTMRRWLADGHHPVSPRAGRRGK